MIAVHNEEQKKIEKNKALKEMREALAKVEGQN